jgi:hypothetical protein
MVYIYTAPYLPRAKTIFFHRIAKLPPEFGDFFLAWVGQRMEDLGEGCNIFPKLVDQKRREWYDVTNIPIQTHGKGVPNQ